MPIIEVGFQRPDGHGDAQMLLEHGPTVRVTVSSFDASESHAETNAKAVYGLIDTGAFESCIDAQLAEDLQLPMVDKASIAGAGGVSTHYVYMAAIEVASLGIRQYGRFTGVNLKAGGQKHDVLIGRTFLQNTIMIYDGLRAQVTLASPTMAK